MILPMKGSKSEVRKGGSRPRVGISACLLGEKVRYDGGHKRDDLLLESLGKHLDFVPVCPEYELGLGVPREPIALAGDPENPRLVGLETGVDLTERMRSFCRKRAGQAAAEGIRGFILKSKSPSCGLGGLEVLQPGGEILKVGVGFWARALLESLPGLPVEESDRLRDPSRQRAFLEKVMAYSGKQSAG